MKQSEQKSLAYLLGVFDLSYREWNSMEIMAVFCKKTNALIGGSGYRFVSLRKEGDESIVSDPSFLKFENRGIDHVKANQASFQSSTDFETSLGVVKYFWSIPIQMGNRLFGIAEFYAESADRVDEAVFHIVESGARQVSFLLERRESEIELQRNYVEIQNAQQQLIQSEKLASLGTISAGVAHEINNPLSFLLSNLETLAIYQQKISSLMNQYVAFSNKVSPTLMDASLADDLDKLQKYQTSIELDYLLNDQKVLVEESLEGVNRISEIVQSLKAFARNPEGVEKSININECVLAALRIASNELKYKCEVIKEMSDLPRVSCNPSHLLQVVMNILINAAQAIEERGRVVIRTSVKGQYILISIQDSGSGISPENQKRLFTPFFTTKPVGKGTGLGLSVSYGIISKMGGEITVESQLGVGSTFNIQIPLKQEAK